MLLGHSPKYFRCVLLAVGVVFASEALNGGAKEAAVPAAVRSQMDAAIAKVKPALVRIRVVSTDYSDGREVKMQAVGSGAIITKDGYLITNHHVAGHATRMFCTLWNREEIEAELVGTDPLTDISVLKLKPEKPMKFKPASFGDSSKLRVGDYVLAMGSPMALSQSVTLGIISNTEMTMPRFWGGDRRFRLDGEDVGSLVRWIGHDAAIYGGNSGGPLVNLRGEIVGINEISYGLGGAIPGNLARSVAEADHGQGQGPSGAGWAWTCSRSSSTARTSTGVLIAACWRIRRRTRRGSSPAICCCAWATTRRMCASRSRWPS